MWIWISLLLAFLSLDYGQKWIETKAFHWALGLLQTILVILLGAWELNTPACYQFNTCIFWVHLHGLPTEWVSWIMKCISIVSYSIKVNGKLTEFFQPTHRIRQGDSLSSYLFIIVANVLSILLNRAVEEALRVLNWIDIALHYLNYFLSMTSSFYCYTQSILFSIRQTLSQYIMSIFKISISICKAIEKNIAALWWNSNENRVALHWRSWDVVKTQKDDSGLRFRDLVTFNEAMLGHQVSQLIQEPQALWSKIFKVYYPLTDLLHVDKGSRPFWVVGNEESISIREDSWLSRWLIGGPANKDGFTWSHL